MDSGSTNERVAAEYPPLPRAHRVLRAPSEGEGAPDGLRPPAPGFSAAAFRFAARFLPRAGALRRALLPPTYGDPSGHVLGDPVRPFLRLRRERFPVAMQTLQTMRAVAARGRTPAASEAAASRNALDAASPASHLSAVIARAPVGLPPRGSVPGRAGAQRATSSTASIVTLTAPIAAVPRASTPAGPLVARAAAHVAPPLMPAAPPSGPAPRRASAPASRTTAPVAPHPAAPRTPAPAPSSVIPGVPAPAAALSVSRVTNVGGRSVRSQLTTVAPSSGAPGGPAPARRRAVVEESTPASRRALQAAAASESAPTVEPPTVARSTPPRAARTEIASEAARQTSTPAISVEPVARAASPLEVEAPRAAFRAPEIPDVGGADALTTLRGRLGARPRSWSALERAVTRTIGRLPDLVRSNITGEEAVSRVFSAASLPDVIAPPPGLTLNRTAEAVPAIPAPARDATRLGTPTDSGPVAARSAASPPSSAPVAASRGLEVGDAAGTSGASIGRASSTPPRAAARDVEPPTNSTAGSVSRAAREAASRTGAVPVRSEGVPASQMPSTASGSSSASGGASSSSVASGEVAPEAAPPAGALARSVLQRVTPGSAASTVEGTPRDALGSVRAGSDAALRVPGHALRLAAGPPEMWPAPPRIVRVEQASGAEPVVGRGIEGPTRGDGAASRPGADGATPAMRASMPVSGERGASRPLDRATEAAAPVTPVRVASTPAASGSGSPSGVSSIVSFLNQRAGDGGAVSRAVSATPAPSPGVSAGSSPPALRREAEPAGTRPGGSEAAPAAGGDAPSAPIARHEDGAASEVGAGGTPAQPSAPEVLGVLRGLPSSIARTASPSDGAGEIEGRGITTGLPVAPSGGVQVVRGSEPASVPAATAGRAPSIEPPATREASATVASRATAESSTSGGTVARIEATPRVTPVGRAVARTVEEDSNAAMRRMSPAAFARLVRGSGAPARGAVPASRPARQGVLSASAPRAALAPLGASAARGGSGRASPSPVLARIAHLPGRVPTTGTPATAAPRATRDGLRTSVPPASPVWQGARRAAIARASEQTSALPSVRGSTRRGAGMVVPAPARGVGSTVRSARTVPTGAVSNGRAEGTRVGRWTASGSLPAAVRRVTGPRADVRRDAFRSALTLAPAAASTGLARAMAEGMVLRRRGVGDALSGGRASSGVTPRSPRGGIGRRVHRVGSVGVLARVAHVGSLGGGARLATGGRVSRMAMPASAGSSGPTEAGAHAAGAAGSWPPIPPSLGGINTTRSVVLGGDGGAPAAVAGMSSVAGDPRIIDFATRTAARPAPPPVISRSLPEGGPAMPSALRSATSSGRPSTGAMGEPLLRRSTVGALPVSGNGAIAAGVATSVAGEIARSVAASAVSEHLERETGEGGTGFVRTSPGGTSLGIARSLNGGAPITVRRALDDSADAEVGAPRDLDAQKDELLRFAMSDEFEERLLEFLEDRLLAEIERRGGRYGGWFA